MLFCLMEGWIPFNRRQLRVKVRSQLDTLTITVPRRYYQSSCNWRFGSPECGIDLADLTETGTVTSQASNGRDFVLSGRSEPKDYYVGGVLTIDGKSQKIVESGSWGFINGPNVKLEYPLPLGMEGKSYQIRPGCGKNKEDCQKFSNFNRYGGFLCVPQNQVRV